MFFAHKEKGSVHTFQAVQAHYEHTDFGYYQEHTTQ